MKNFNMKVFSKTMSSTIREKQPLKMGMFIMEIGKMVR